MSAASDRLAGRLLAHYLNSGHIIGNTLVDDLNAIAAVANEVAAGGESAAATQAAIDATYALAQALLVPAYGVGIDPAHLVRALNLGGLAFQDPYAALGLHTITQNAAYQILPQDFGKLVLTTTGTNTWTLPVAAALPAGWYCRLRNRSGNNLTMAVAASDAINAGAGGASLTVATASAMLTCVRTSATTFEIA
jgi:hypothetical protein